MIVMKDSIILFSHNIHAFMFHEVPFAAMTFKRVIVVAPENQELSSVCCRYENIRYEPIKARWGFKECADAFTQIDKTVLSEVYQATANKLVTVDYLKNMMYYLRCKFVLNNICRKYIDDQGDRWVIESMWLFATAYAISSIREDYKKATLVSLAHAFEIDDTRNAQIDYSCLQFCHERLDYISFISKNKMNEYLINHVRRLGWREDNCHLDYLGTIKTDSALSSPSGGMPFHIVTCGRCIALKRLDLLIEALKLVDTLRIKWTHIGDGDEFQKLREKSKSLPSNITVSWLGAMSNEKVHKFYAENDIDMVLNLSTTEGVSVSLMEALSYGIPIIATDVGGNSEVCDDTVGILLPAAPSPDEVKTAVENILSLSREDTLNIRRQANEKYKDRFDASRIRTSYYQKLKDICPL